MPIRIREAKAADAAQAVFRLRYEVYVEELGREQRHADHARRLIEEPLDASGHVLVASDGTRAVGTLRINYARHGQLSEYAALYEMARIGPAYPAYTSVVTKLLVALDYRNTSLAYRLCMSVYRRALGDGMLFDFIDVYPNRVEFFERLGYRVHLPHADHPEYGSVVVMRLAMRDADHLKKVGSPFARYLQHAQAAA